MRERLAGIWIRLRAAGARVAGWRPVALTLAHPYIATALIVVSTVSTAAIWGTTCGLAGCPTDAELRAFRPSEGGRVLDRDGELIGHLQSVRRVNVPLARIPRQVQLAFIAVEDRRFYAHHGIDWHGAARAVWQNGSHLELREGSSTLTMQAARTAFLGQYEGQRSLRRKLIELSIARRLEGALTKSQILELYLNTIYLGDDTYGVEAASRHYFGKSVNRLTLGEAALLAGLPRAPSAYEPRRHPDRARDRRNLVLTLMVEQHFIAAKAADRARRAPIETAERGWRPDESPSDALDMVRAAVDSMATKNRWPVGELIVRTTFDVRAQRAAERAVRDRAAAIGREAGAPEGVVQGAMVAIDPVTGELRAVVGSSVYRPNGFNRALAAHRQPGSAFKPFVYAAALEAGFTPATMVADDPVEVSEGGQVWRPENYGGVQMGTITLRDALARSLNTATVRVSQQAGLPRIIDVARRAGITSPLQPVPSLALGAFEVTPMELVTAYAPIANGGLRVIPAFLSTVESGSHRTLWQATPTSRTRALDARDAFLLTSMLQSVVDEGTARSIRMLGVTVPVAGKTGTTNDGNDVWFVGYTQTVIAGFWFGRDVPQSLTVGASGGRLAAPAWAAFYRNGWHDDRDDNGWSAPPGVVQVSINPESGLAANDWCGGSRDEWFREGTQPREGCTANAVASDDAMREHDDGDSDREAMRQFARRNHAMMHDMGQDDVQRVLLQALRRAFTRRHVHIELP